MYVHSVREALADYHCEILSCVAKETKHSQRCAWRVAKSRRVEVTSLWAKSCIGWEQRCSGLRIR
jgi:hypothetical protein